MKHAEGSNALFAKALEGIKFPATRDQLVEQATKNNAEPSVLEVIKNMPDDGEYKIMPDVFMNTREGKDAVAAQQQTKKPTQAKAK